MEPHTKQFFWSSRTCSWAGLCGLMVSATGSSCLSVQLSAGAGPRGCFSSSPPQAQPCLPRCFSLPTPNSGSCASDGHMGSCLSVLKRHKFWPEGVTEGGTEQEWTSSSAGGWEEGVCSLLESTGTARHCSEMWHNSVATECHLCVGKTWSKSLYCFFFILGCLSVATWTG